MIKHDFFKIILLVSIVFPVQLHGQLFGNIEKISTDYAVRPSFSFMGNALQITSKENASDKFLWKTHSPGNLGVSVKLKWLTLGYSRSLPLPDRALNRYGKSSFHNLQVGFSTRFSEFQLFFNRFNGFYLTQPEKYYSDWERKDNHPTREQTSILNVGMNLMFQTNKNFSMKAAFAQTERQKESKGSLLLMLSPRYSSLRTDSALVPITFEAQLPHTYSLKRASFASFILGAGMGYSFVAQDGKFNITPVWLLGSGLQLGAYKTGEKEKLKIRAPLYGQGRLAIGWNGEKFYTNIVGITEINTFGVHDSKMKFIYYTVELGVGVRF